MEGHSSSKCCAEAAEVDLEICTLVPGKYDAKSLSIVINVPVRTIIDKRRTYAHSALCDRSRDSVCACMYHVGVFFSHVITYQLKNYI